MTSECAPAIKKKFEWVELSKRPEHSFVITQLINWACSEYSAGAQTHKNRLMEIRLKARIDEGKGMQGRIIDR